DRAHRAPGHGCRARLIPADKKRKAPVGAPLIKSPRAVPVHRAHFSVHFAVTRRLAKHGIGSFFSVCAAGKKQPACAQDYKRAQEHFSISTHCSDKSNSRKKWFPLSCPRITKNWSFPERWLRSAMPRRARDNGTRSLWSMTRPLTPRQKSLRTLGRE